MFNPIKRLVSENRQRYVYDNVDLDLSYITKRIIAMGYPSDGLEGLYRNHWVDVKNFLETHHGQHYKIFNLRAEKTYDKTKFSGTVADYPFKDHQVPPLPLIQVFCQDASDWLDLDAHNVVVVHCKAGKGRTGLMIAALLLHIGQAKDAREAIKIYGTHRTKNGKGVTIPSQIRYVDYYGSTVNGSPLEKRIRLKTLILHPVPTKYTGNGGRWVMFQIVDSQDTLVYDQSRCMMTRSAQTLTIETNGINTITGDFKVQFSCYHHWKKRPLCHFWLNTAFLGDHLKLAKQDIDLAFSDKLCKDFDMDFTIELGYDLC